MYRGWTGEMSAGVEGLPVAAEADERDAGFAVRVEENQRRVFQIAYGVLRNAADAEEVAQEAFLRAYRKLASLRDPEKFRGWVKPHRVSARAQPKAAVPATGAPRYGMAGGKLGAGAPGNAQR